MESKFLFVICLVLAIILANAALKMYKRSNDAKVYLDATKNEFLSLEDQYNRAKEDLNYIKSDTGTEKEIRSKFDLAREGERAVLIIEEDLPEIQEPQRKSFWKKVFDWASF